MRPQPSWVRRVVSLVLAVAMVFIGMPQTTLARTIERPVARAHPPLRTSPPAASPTRFTSTANTQSSYSLPHDIGVDLQGLLDATTDPTDTDGDGLPDAVERVLGTDKANPDSDFDRLNDYYEIEHGLNPMQPDSNEDGLADYYEVTGLPADLDRDGIDNAWDDDNDGDGVGDASDLSPSLSLDVSEGYHFDITGNGRPTYITFQLVPGNRQHLRLFGQVWDWPDNDHEGSFQDRDNSKEDIRVIPLLQLTVNRAPTPGDVADYGITVNGNDILLPLLPVTQRGEIVAFAGRMVYPTATPSLLAMDARLVWRVVGKNDPDPSTLSQDTLLATYIEGFSLTGMTVEESQGTDVALLYSDQIKQTVAANLLLAYQFLRNPANHVDDVAGILAANGIDMGQRRPARFAHRDAALASIATDLMPTALASLPAGQKLPVLTVIEDQFVGVGLSEFEAVSTNSFRVSLAARQATAAKTLKECWYDTAERDVLAIDEVMRAIRDLGLGESASSNLMTLMLYWQTGERTLEGPAIPENVPGPEYDAATQMAEKILGSGGLIELGVLEWGLLGSYRSVELLASQGWKPALAQLGDVGKYTKLVKSVDSLKSPSKFAKFMEVADDALDSVLSYADAGLAAYKVIQLAHMTNLSSFQLTNEVMTVTMNYYYGIALAFIGAIPYVGWILAIGIELSDLIGDWSSDLSAWLAGLFTDVDAYVSPNVEVTQPTITVVDNDHNGFNVGDRIQLESEFTATLQRIGADTEAELIDIDVARESKLYPYYSIAAPVGSNSTAGSPYSRTVTIRDSESIFDPGESFTIPISDPVATYNDAAGKKTIQYASAAWIEPGTAMPNFPVVVNTKAHYELWYSWSYWLFLVFYWEWMYFDALGSSSAQAGAAEWNVGSFTYYVDVMPGTIGDFAEWSSLAPLDHDGDGLKDGLETASDRWLYDTDGDGLNDKYEVDTGSDPRRYDTDQDGLPDAAEIMYGTDLANPDTDGDGLKDSLEVGGWVTTFTYNGHQFTMRVTSNPTAPDSDGDGVNDSGEYWSDLNPRSRDTDGDGVSDVANPKFVTPRLQLENAWGFRAVYGVDSNRNLREFRDFAVDAQENIYIVLKGVSDGQTPCVYKYNSIGFRVRRWWTFADADLSWMAIDLTNNRLFLGVPFRTWVSDLWGDTVAEWVEHGGPTDVDRNGTVYITQAAGHGASGERYRIYKFPADGSPWVSWGGSGLGPTQFQNVRDISVDNTNGYLYVIDERAGYTRIAKFTNDGSDCLVPFADGNHCGDLPDSVYVSPQGLDVDNKGNVYVANTGNNTILKFNSDGVLVASLGESGEEDGQLMQPFAIQVNDNGDVYIADRPSQWAIGRVQKFSEVSGRPAIPAEVPDGDGDGLDNDVETAGWSVTFTDATHTQTISVTADPLLSDSDFDGVTDLQERQVGTNPRNPDTDGDGVNDSAELRAGTDPKQFDTDGDGLPDGVEISYGSNPNSRDTDGDGLSDLQELGIGSNPRSSDTDGDGLDDAAEVAKNANPNSADSDGDFVFDGAEVNAGTDITNPDTDGDGLSDGQEIAVYETDPRNGDTDNDGLTDGREVELRLNPKLNDTDGDGVPDGTEVDQGTNPFIDDSDHDGVPDGREVGNRQPVVNAGPDATIDEGGHFTSSGSFADPDSTNFLARIDYGDGSGMQPLPLDPGKTFALNHTYSDNGTFVVTLTVIDGDGGEASDAVTVMVNNVAPVVSGGPDATIIEGGTFARTAGVADPGADTLTALVNYGDGSGAVPLPVAGKALSLNHRYPDNGAYTVAITVTDDDGGTGTDYVTVMVDNVAPVVSAGQDTTVSWGRTFDLNAGFTDPGANDAPWNFTVNWGDGTSVTGSTSAQGPGAIVTSHKYLVPGRYTVSVDVIDKDGGRGSDEVNVETRPLQVQSDIKPGSASNPINLKSKGNVPVAVLSGTYQGIHFDATKIVRSSLAFAGAPALSIGMSPQDLDNDGDLDMVFHFDTEALQLVPTATRATLTGYTSDGIYFEATDRVQIVPGK